MEKISSSIYQFIRAHVEEQDILLEEPMCKHTTFRVGGTAQCLIRISSRDQLVVLIPYLKKVDIPYFILGNGSNLLVGDKGYDGIVLQIGSRFSGISLEGTYIRVQSGALLSQTAAFALENSLTGLEFASGIPGTVGGGVVMNAGAYEGEMSQVVEQVTVMNEQGEIMELNKETMEFGYRTSIIKNRPFIVLEVLMRLEAGQKDQIRTKMEELSRRRREKQPLEYASAGSTFKRPEGHFAGKLIMEAGMRGYSIGGAQVSEKHCGFIINTGRASAADVAEVIREVQDRVKERFGVTLEREVIYLGEF